MGPDRPIEPIEGLAATPLVVRDVVVEGLGHGVGPMFARAPIFPGYFGEPPPTRCLGLGKGQDVLAVCVGHVVRRAEGLEAPSVVRGVVAGDPSPALGAPSEADGEAFGDRPPVRLTTSLQLCPAASGV